MKKSQHSEEKIIAVLKEAASGAPVPEVCRRAGISHWTFYKWKKRYSGMEVQEARRMRELEAENTKLKKIVANLSLDNLALKDVLSKKW